MRAWFHMLLLCGLSVVFSGCAGVGIFATSDPATRLHDASDLFDRKDSPLIAEKFIREVSTVIGKTTINRDWRMPT